MKKLIVLLTASLIISSNSINAQNLIAVQNGGIPSFYTMLDSAIFHAQNGDTIYIPGGGFSISLPINKRLHIFGVGHHPDSTIATNYTIITGDIYVLSNASYGPITGLFCSGALRFGDNQTNQDVIGFHVSRCNIQNQVHLGFLNTSGATNNVFIENVFAVIYLYNSMSNAFYNNLIVYAKDIGMNNVFRNNNFYFFGGNTYQDIYFWYGVQASIVNSISSIFENNIFCGGLYSSGGYNSNLSNNIFNNNIMISGSVCSGCIYNNNVTTQSQSGIFVNYLSGQNFQYNYNFHLQASCLGKNAGKDGTDIGIYGGAFPWKEGSIPSNPHFQIVKIAPTTDINGNLNVNIKVKAQDN